jgi:TonB family protein
MGTGKNITLAGGICHFGLSTTRLAILVLRSQTLHFCVAAYAADAIKIVSNMSATFLGVISVERVIDGKFPLLQELGGTESSSAYLTEINDGQAHNAAIKIFPFESVDILTTTARWEVAETLSHPHLMPLFCTGRCEFEGKDLLYVVTKYADETLSQILPERALTPHEAREMLGPVLDALSYLHQRGLTHGHLRPTNIMVIEDQVMLSPDFGWCSRTRSLYDPPEADAGNVTPAGDIWSLGILLVEALTQQPPAWDTSQGGEQEIPSTIPEPFYTICRECLRVDPARRCTLAAIEALLDPTQVRPPQLAEPAAELAVEPTEAIIDGTSVDHTSVDGTAKPFYGRRAKILAGTVVVLLLTFAAFNFGWNLTPTSAAPAPQPTVPQPTATPAPHAFTASAPSAASTAQPIRTPAPAAESPAGVVKGSPTHQAMPDIPANIAGAIQGHFKVEIGVAVDPAGNVSHASIDSAGPSSYFADRALRAAQNWKFTPAKVDGRAVASTWLLQFQFGRSQSVVTQSEETP